MSSSTPTPAEQHQQRRPHAANGLLVEVYDPGAPAAVAVRMPRRHRRGVGGDLLVGLARASRRQPGGRSTRGNASRAPADPMARPSAGLRAASAPRGRSLAGCASPTAPSMLRYGNTNCGAATPTISRVSLPTNAHAPADDRRVGAETPPPRGVAEHRDVALAVAETRPSCVVAPSSVEHPRADARDVQHPWSSSPATACGW